MPFALTSLALVGVLLVFLNLHGMRTDKSTELTTSAALLVTCVTGVVCGLGHRVTPVAVSVVTAGLLSWKESLADFGHKLTAAELRSAILLGILAFAVYPVLPAHPIDPWGLIAPRDAWLTVLLIAGVGFGNYILWKLFGTRGIEFAGFLGGLVNSTVTVNELSARVADGGRGMIAVAYRGILLSVAAMSLRNAVLLGLLQPKALLVAGATLSLMLLVSSLAAMNSAPPTTQGSEGKPLELSSPFSLASALKFGVIYLALQIAGTGAQWLFGHFGFYAVSVVGGFVSSASAVAAAATLASTGQLTPAVAGVGSVVASIASASVNVILVGRLARSPELSTRVRTATLVVVAVGLAGAIVTAYLT